jgi:hypothetical protein
MQILLVVNQNDSWPLNIEGVQIVTSRAYLSEPHFSIMRRVRVFNLCRSYSYQSVGYYVSLLAEARGHKPPLPVKVILRCADSKRPVAFRYIVGGDGGSLMQDPFPVFDKTGPQKRGAEGLKELLRQPVIPLGKVSAKVNAQFKTAAFKRRQAFLDQFIKVIGNKADHLL